MSSDNVLPPIGSPMPRKWRIRLNGIDAHLVEGTWRCEDPSTLFTLQKDYVKSFDETRRLGNDGPRSAYEHESFTVAHAVEHLGAEDLTPPPEYVTDEVLF